MQSYYNQMELKEALASEETRLPEISVLFDSSDSADTGPRSLRLMKSIMGLKGGVHNFSDNPYEIRRHTERTNEYIVPFIFKTPTKKLSSENKREPADFYVISYDLSKNDTFKWTEEVCIPHVINEMKANPARVVLVGLVSCHPSDKDVPLSDAKALANKNGICFLEATLESKNHPLNIDQLRKKLIDFSVDVFNEPLYQDFCVTLKKEIRDYKAEVAERFFSHAKQRVESMDSVLQLMDSAEFSVMRPRDKLLKLRARVFEEKENVFDDHRIHSGGLFSRCTAPRLGLAYHAVLEAFSLKK